MESFTAFIRLFLLSSVTLLSVFYSNLGLAAIVIQPFNTSNRMNLTNVYRSNCTTATACGNSSGTITLRPESDNSIYTTGTIGYRDNVNAVLYSQRASVLVTDDAASAGHDVQVTLPTSCTLTTGGNNIIASNFTYFPSSVKLAAAGNDSSATFYIGATFTIPTNQAIGTYTSGTCNLQVQDVQGGDTANRNITINFNLANGGFNANIAVSQTSAVNFGIVSTGNIPSTIFMDPNTGLVSTTSGSAIASGSPQRGAFAINKNNAGTTNVYISASNGTLSNGSSTIEFRPSTSVSYLLAPAGTAGNPLGINFYTGGTLLIGANQLPGTYTGTYNVLVNF